MDIRSQQTKAGNLLGGNWGIGLAIALDSKSSRRANKASLVDGVVRIDDNEDKRIGLIVETHFLCDFFKGKTVADKCKGEDNGNTTFGFGPFVALRFGGDDVIDAAGGGVMFGVKKPSDTLGGLPTFFNIGIGYFIEKDVRTLGNGVREGSPLPGNETSIRFQEKSVGSWLFMASFMF